MTAPGKHKHRIFRGFLDIMSEMNRAQEQWMNRGTAPPGPQQNGSSEAAGAYVPLADIFAVGDDVIVRCEAAGARTDDIQITVSGGVLTVTGHRDSELDEDEAVFYTRERMYGNFRRSMLLPEGIGEEHVSARVRNGLLEITVKDAAHARAQHIDIVDANDPE